MDKDRLKTIVKQLYFDRNIDLDYAISLIAGKPEQFPGDRIDLYRRFLNSCDWYTILNVFSVKELKTHVLDETVIQRVFPKDLQDKYRYARNIL